MKNTYKIIIISIVFLAFGIFLWYNFSGVKGKSKVESANAEKSVESNETKTAVKASPNIVIYNTHADEEYVSGKKVTDVASLINDKLIKEGLSSSFIKCSPPETYAKAYEASRDVIMKNVVDYGNTVLLDIHRDITDNSKSDTKKILIELVEKNPHYEANKKFAENLLNEINKTEGVKCEIVLYDKGISYFNQDLSNNAILIELGNNKSSDSDVEKCINSIVSALKNIETSL